MPAAMMLGLIVLVALAAWSDLRTRRIPNSITVTGAAAGLLLQAFYHGVSGAVQSLAGAGFGLAIFLVFYVASGMGAGDVKLFGAVGAFAGPQAVVVLFVFTAALGGVAALALALWRRRLGATLIRTGERLIGRLRFNELPSAAASPESLRLPYAAVIAGGTSSSLSLPPSHHTPRPSV